MICKTREGFQNMLWGFAALELCNEVSLTRTWETEMEWIEMDYPPKTNMTMENPPFEDVFPIENGDFPASHVSLPGFYTPEVPVWTPYPSS